MSWADAHIARLQKGETVQFRPVGNSMTPLIKSRQLVTVIPVGALDPHSNPSASTLPVLPGAVVLVKLNGRVLLHKVTAIGKDGRCQISNNHGHVNGWAMPENVYGVVVKVEP